MRDIDGSAAVADPRRVRIRHRLLGAVVVIGAAAFAACFASPEVSTTSQGVVVVNGGSAYDFGQVMVGDFKTSGPITIAPASLGDDDNVVSVDAPSCTEFTINVHPPLPASSARVYNLCNTVGGSGYGSSMNCVQVTYDFDATYTPSGAGSASCTVRVTLKSNTGSGGSYLQFFTLNGQGVAPSVGMTVGPTSIQFGDVPVGTSSSSQAVTLKNTGSQPLTVSGTNTDARFVVMQPLGPHTLPGGASEHYNVQCRPGTSDAFSFMGSLTFAASGVPSQTVTFSCRGITSSLIVSESPVTFPSTLVGVPQTKTITIDSGGPQTLTSLALSAATSNEVTLVSPPAAGTSFGSGAAPLPITLRYAAGTPHPSGPIGTLVITTPGEVRNVALFAEALPGQIGTTPATVDFGPVCGGSSPTQDVQIYASAAGTVQLISVQPPDAPFTVSGGSGALVGNHGAGITVTAGLTATTPGELMASFTLQTNAPDDPMHEVPLHAVVLPAGVSPTPERQHFGGSMLNQPVVREVVISNCATQMINVTAARITGASASDFTIVDPANPAMTIPQRGSTRFLIAMTPHSNGLKDAQLVVDYEGGSVTANLDGNGFGGDDGTAGGRKTYYACSTGQPAGLWPILGAVLAVLGVRRRRR